MSLVNLSSIKGAFDFHSSSIDWCEENYQVSPHIVEFYNTISNIVFILGPIFPIAFLLPHVKKIGWAPVLSHMLLMVIGTGSAYFHATLSFVGQIVDELSIMWLLLFCTYVYLPDSYLSEFGIHDQTTKNVVFTMLTIFFSVTPYAFGPDFSIIVAPFQLIFGIPVMYIVIKEAYLNRHLTSRESKSLVVIAGLLFLVAAGCWLVDRLMCGTVGAVELHALWHVLIYWVGNIMMTYFAYMKIVIEQHRDINPVLRGWPHRSVLPFAFPLLDIVKKKGK